ncbi:glutamine amidotransferase-related protein [Synoicihabitans lomoniglobus]|uniref:CTP synthase (glutamine hydrolyzing) n=1 Tax=Synoicihabitans lomoniglobus TaxID=2909285 RepID=A0AAF0CMA5_9BACT|nr:hypothetical protein [Opitutaceae bacterium LMO-M01]WED63843.1 hypothetical protein PXH66_16010 [Opitutaceae bacterium LMO-M01]
MTTRPSSRVIVLVGDRDDTVTAHPAIERSLQAAGATWQWLPTTQVGNPAATLPAAAGVWCVPASPYRSTTGALNAIQFARENRIPFLGTCGGFQHLLLECARDRCGAAENAHAEIDGEAEDPVCVPLSCSLREALGTVRFTPGSQLAALLGTRCADVGYNCGFSLSPAWQPRLEAVGLRFTGFDEANGEIRAGEFAPHPFCIGTLFQPERAILRGDVHPLVTAFVAATKEIRGDSVSSA